MEHFTLPFPPSLNMMYPTNRQGRRYTSKRGVGFKDDVKKLMALLKPKCFRGELKISINLFRPAKIGDIDNYCKPILDSLKTFCFDDDKQIVELHVYRFDDKRNPRVEIEISEF